METLLTLGDLARLLGRSAETIRKDVRRKPGAVPPFVVLPGTRQMRWRPSDVQKWLDAGIKPAPEGDVHE